MKKLIIALVAFLSFSFNSPFQSNKQLNAMFEGVNDGVYYFVDSNDESYEFVIIDETILKKYDLSNNELLIDKSFNIVYEIVSDEDGIEDYVILSLSEE